MLKKNSILNEKTKKELLEDIVVLLNHANEKVPMFRHAYPDINKYLEYMAKVAYCMKEMKNDNMDENIKLSKEDVVLMLEKYFILDDSAIQYLQAHGYTFPSQKAVNATSGNIRRIISYILTFK